MSPGFQVLVGVKWLLQAHSDYAFLLKTFVLFVVLSFHYLLSRFCTVTPPLFLNFTSGL